MSKKWEEHLQAAPVERHEAIRQAVRWMCGSLLAGPHLLTGPDPTTTARLILGEHPQEIAPRLTRAEACAWARQSEHVQPLSWLWANLCTRHGISKAPSPNTFAVARWAERCLASPHRRPAILRDRKGGIATPIEGVAIQRLDEITPKDLHPSVGDTLRAAAHRALKETWDGPDELIPASDYEKTLPPGVTVLRHFRTLLREGIEMRHCVAQYAKKIHNRECWILAVDREGARSTVEIRDGKINQHVGHSNGPPPPSHVQLLKDTVSGIKEFGNG